MLLFNLLLLGMSLVAYFRGPIFSPASIPWLFFSWLSTGMPWVFGIIQFIAILVLLPNLIHPSLSDFIALAIGLLSLSIWVTLHRICYLAEAAYENALQKGLGENYTAELPTDLCITSTSFIADRAWLKPFAFERKGVERIADIAYGPDELQKLDIRRPTTTQFDKGNNILRPVLLHTHGGGWSIGLKNQQSQPLLNYLVQNGWICVDINYRLAPRHKFPNQIIDVKQAIVWIKENIATYGGDPNFIAISGGSAGGQLCAISALTGNHPRFQPGFEEKDTRLQAAVPIYGVYDFTELKGWAYQNLKEQIMPPEHSEDMEYWKSTSPTFQIDEHAPPMFVIHGDCDTIFPIENVPHFINALHQKSKAKVAYAELRGVQHGFDIYHSVRTEFHIEAVGKFLHYCYGKYAKR